MKYEIATVRQLKAAVFDAIEKDVVLSRSCLESFASFNSSVCDYIEYSSEPGVLSRRACPALCTVRSWYKELLTLYPTYDAGFQQLLAQQQDEIAIVAATFDYSRFAGATGPLSGIDSQ